MSTLPNVGDLNWGPELNDYITNVILSAATNASVGLITHETATDPHADRAYANSLIAALFATANLPGGFVQLNAQGFIPSSLVKAGAITTIYDVVANYGATGNGSTDDSAAINAALAAANINGGGQVWVPCGTYAIGSTLVIGANTWLHLDQGAVIKRIANPSVPLYMLANFTPTSSPGAQNILVTGGSWTVGATTQSCQVMAFIDATNVAISGTNMTHSANSNSCAIIFAGCSNCSADQVYHFGPAPSGSRNSFSTSAVRVESSSSNAIPGLLAGVYTGLGCRFISLTNHNLNCNTSSDGGGPYCLFSYFCGNHFNSGIGHTNIYLGNCKANACGNATHLATGPWSFFTCAGNTFTNCGTNIPTGNVTNFFGNGTNNIQYDVNTWFTVAGKHSWSGNFQHKRSDVNHCHFSCTGCIPGTFADDTVICTVPYTPVTEQWHHAVCHRSGSNTYVTISIKITITGDVHCYGVPSDADQFHCNAIVALDR
jgi:hypothetical protein